MLDTRTGIGVEQMIGALIAECGHRVVPGVAGRVSKQASVLPQGKSVAAVSTGATAFHATEASSLERVIATFGLPSVTVEAAEVAADLRSWAATFPFADAQRFGALALTTAVHLPGLPRPARALAARLNAWIYAFDDLVDGVPPGRTKRTPRCGQWRLTDDALDRLVARCLEVAQAADRREHWPQAVLLPEDGEEAPAVVRALSGIVQEVAARPGFAPLAALWHDTFSRMLSGIVRERRLEAALADGMPPPSPAAHLATGRYSIGAPHYLTTCFVLQMEHDDPALPRRLPALTALSLAAADVARLANDLATWLREEREGTFNSVRAADAALARAMPGLPAIQRRAHAVQVVERLLVAARMQVHALVASAPTPLAKPEAGIIRLVEFIPALYAIADFHTFGEQSPLADPSRPQVAASGPSRLPVAS